MKTPPFTEEEFAEIIQSAFTGDKPDILVQMNGVKAYAIVALLQFAERGLPAGHSLKGHCQDLGRQIQAAVVEAIADPRIAEILELGWDPEYDHVEQPAPTIEVHNAWTIYGMDNAHTVAEQPLAMHGRPQDWGDPERWTSHRTRFEWATAPDGRTYINHCHCWTDLNLESPARYLELFAPLIVQILMPGEPAQLCGRDYLQEEDFWDKSWGQQPPFYDLPPDEIGLFYGDDESDNDEEPDLDWPGD